MKQTYYFSLFFFFFLFLTTSILGQKRVQDYDMRIGIFDRGEYNAITDVKGVLVGHKTIIMHDSIRTGVTAIIPHENNIFRNKVPAAIYIANGFGKLAGYSQVKELGNIETPILLTNTLSVAPCIDALIDYTLSFPENSNIGSVNSVVGETNDGYLNYIRGRVVTKYDALEALKIAKSGVVDEGAVGAGTGTVSFGFKAGIGTSSRVLPESLGGYTVGVLVQSNYGGVLEVDGVKMGEILNKHDFINHVSSNSDGSCMIVVITDAPILSRNLERVAKRAMLGLAKTGGIASNGSGDYVIALSINESNLVNEQLSILNHIELQNHQLSAIFAATIEATEEALLNALFVPSEMTGYRGRRVEKFPVNVFLNSR